jgi:hypothetical protein
MHTSFLDSLEDSPGSRNMNNSVDDPKIEQILENSGLDLFLSKLRVSRMLNPNDLVI